MSVIEDVVTSRVIGKGPEGYKRGAEVSGDPRERARVERLRAELDGLGAESFLVTIRSTSSG